MAISLKNVVKGKQPVPPRLVVYGVDGIGKSTLGACAPDPIFIATEKGTTNIDTSKFPLAETYNDVVESMDALLNEQHDFSTLVVDSLDWLEPLIWDHVCKLSDKGYKSIEDFGYGKGYTEAANIWQEFYRKLDLLNTQKSMAIILIAHSHIKRFDNPETDPYDRYEIALHKTAGQLAYQWPDAVLFANYKAFTTKAEVGFNKEVTRAVGAGARVLYTAERPAFKAKNRYSLPDEIPLNWDALVSGINKSYETPTQTQEQKAHVA